MNHQNFHVSDTSNFLFQPSSEILIITNQNGIIINTNTLAESFFNRSPLNGLVAKDILSLKTKKGEIVGCPILKCIQENQTIESLEPLLLVQNNKLVTFKAIPINIDKNNYGCLFIIRDINQTEKIKNLSQEDIQNLPTIFKNAPLGIAIIDIWGNILEVNSAMLTILGSPSAEATKQINILQFKPLQETPLIGLFNKALETKNITSDTAKYFTKWGKLIYVYYQLVPIIQDDEVKQIWLYVNDLTPVYIAQEKETLIKNQIALLHQFSYEFITLDNSYNPFVFIGEKVKKLFPDCTITINKYYPTKNLFITEFLYSPKPSVQELSEKLKQKKALLSYTLPQELWPLNFQGKFIKIPHEDFLTVQFSIKQEEIIKLLLTAQVESIYSMGFINNSILMGNITLFTHKEETNIEILELLINQASLLLQRHLSQKKINENHAFYKSILNTIDDFILVVDVNYKIVFTNQPLLQLLANYNYSTSVLGLEIKEAVPFLNQNIYNYLITCKNTKQSQLFQSTSLINNTLVYYQTNISYLSTDQDDEQFIIAIRDVTKLALKSKEVETLTSINQKIIENLNEGVLIVDTDYKIKVVNQPFCDYFEIEKNKLTDTSVINVFPPKFKDKAIEIINNLKQNPTNLYFEFPFENSKGIKKIFSEELHPIIENNKVIFILVLVKDITEQKNRELTLIDSKEKAELSNRLKSTFIATISHEIRNSLNAIHGFAHLLQKADLSDNKRDQYIKQINASSSTLSRIIDDLIDYTKFETGNLQLIFETVFLYDLLKELYEQYQQELLIRNKQHISLVLENTPDDNLPFETDKLRLKQILSNLLINAIKYTYSGKICFGYKIYNNSIIFYVKDTGTGIKEEHIPQLFKPFVQLSSNYTTEQKGAGLGLTIIKTLTELMGGSIHVESKWQVGSTFSVRFPYRHTFTFENTTTNVEKHCSIARPLTILIAEDDDINYMFIEEMLSEYNFTLIHARNGKEAVELFTEKMEQINLVLMDIQMPIMDGFVATQKIKILKPDIPVIAQTAYAYSTEIEMSKQVGCSDYIIKPIELEVLIQKIEQYAK
ncbi:MAG: PAS domain S-box protein [Bacteroidales bacterium]|nr:PAS domain S-box protein [Bacteroidales bacterium]